MNDFPKPLSEVEEKELLNAMSEGDLVSRKLLIEHNLRLVNHIVKKFDNDTQDFEDLISIGVQGLIKAIDTFEINRGVKLATYAARCIENEILIYLRSKKEYDSELSESSTQHEIQKFISNNNLTIKIYNTTNEVLSFNHINKIIISINEIMKKVTTKLNFQLCIVKSNDNYLTIQLDSIIKDPYLYELNIFTIVFLMNDNDEFSYEIIYNFESKVVSDIILLQTYITEAIIENIENRNSNSISLSPPI
ncbi:sigma-70 family RNA polymerase sigma factor [Paenibacillus typhae]|uniref:RNA polymerase sigma factor, sigma-70 family n=2 Tax=Paenibacillus typhae TaxID=1174501 RepID=A0A1G8GNC0_9BACL|nr:sigma-70 family RNA polymerase sigma factor [Paenibacillus typhae]SDH95895.1 RNA polymerase sigma factor, sigma-70 family [Paenibacillus typhae]